MACNKLPLRQLKSVAGRAKSARHKPGRNVSVRIHKGEKMKKNLPIISAIILLSGCSAAHYIDKATAQYDQVENRVNLGDSKEQVLAILMPTQESVPRNSRKKSDRYLKDGVNVEIYYMRTGRQADGITTDDEFTPCIFNDGKLVGIGWNLIGGPKSQGQTTSDTYINTTNRNTTIVY